MSSLLPIQHVTPGMVIVQITQQNGPVKIRKSGLVTSEAMVQGLAEMGVQEVEIDAEQTVEIEPVMQHRTQTQALIRGEHDTSAKFDKSLSDQFNRSLFLPSVQGLPSAWKAIVKDVALYALVLLGGGAIGFSAATRTAWWPLITASAANSQSLTTSNQSTPAASSDTSPVRSSNSNDQQSANSGLVERNQQRDEQSNDIAETAKPIAPRENVELGSTPASAQGENRLSVSNDPEPTVLNTDTTEYEGRVLNESSDSDVSVSPELMARFNAAVRALDQKAEDSEPPQEETTVTVRDSLIRVDQLPVRLLSRLPTMNFSAHMYASRPSDRWVRVNGRQLGEGDWIEDRVQIVNIEAQRVVLAFEDEIFSMAALTDW
jgi:general secretion pathway protein B